MVDVPRSMVDVPRSMVDVPRSMVDVPRSMVDVPCSSSPTPTPSPAPGQQGGPPRSAPGLALPGCLFPHFRSPVFPRRGPAVPRELLGTWQGVGEERGETCLRFERGRRGWMRLVKVPSPRVDGVDGVDGSCGESAFAREGRGAEKPDKDERIEAYATRVGPSTVLCCRKADEGEGFIFICIQLRGDELELLPFDDDEMKKLVASGRLQGGWEGLERAGDVTGE